MELPEHTKSELLLQQYKEAHERDRHYDRMAWTMGDVLIPVASALVVAAAYVGTTPWRLAALGVASVGILFAWFIMFGRMNHLQESESRRLIQAIEQEKAGLCHKSFEEINPKRMDCNMRIGKLIGVRRAIFILVGLFIIVYVLLGVYIHYIPKPS